MAICLRLFFHLFHKRQLLLGRIRFFLSQLSLHYQVSLDNLLHNDISNNQMCVDIRHTSHIFHQRGQSDY